MDHSLFSCLRSTHPPVQGLHPAITQSPLTLHDRSDHVSYLDVPSFSPPYHYPGGEDNAFCSPDHLPQKQHPLHPQHPPGWPISLQMPSPNTVHSVYLPPPKVTAPELCSTNPSPVNGDPTGASCLSGEYGQQSLSSEKPDRRRSKGKNESSGKNTKTMMHLVWIRGHSLIFLLQLRLGFTPHY